MYVCVYVCMYVCVYVCMCVCVCVCVCFVGWTILLKIFFTLKLHYIESYSGLKH